jgi:hypothetical protein
MAKIINLNRARKARDKATGKTRADENAVRFGRTKAQKQVEALEARKAQRDLSAHQRDDDA